MQVEVRLFATLRSYLPATSDGVSARVEVPTGACIADVAGKLGIPPTLVHLVLVDGHAEADRCRRLAEGSVLSIWPPIAGG